LSHVALLVRPLLVGQLTLEAQLFLLFRLFRSVLVGQHLLHFLPFHPVLSILWHLRVPLLRVSLLVRPRLLGQGALEAQLVLLSRLLQAIRLGQHLRHFLVVRRVQAFLGHLRVPLARVYLVVRALLLGQVGLAFQLILMFRLVRALLVGQHPRHFLPFRRLLLVLWDLVVHQSHVYLMVRPFLMGQAALEDQLDLVVRLFQELLKRQHLHLFLTLRRFLPVLCDLGVPLAHVPLLVLSCIARQALRPSYS